MRTALTALTIILLLTTLSAHAQEDTLHRASTSSEASFSGRQLALPAMLVVAGAAGINGRWMPEINEWGNHWGFRADDYLRFVPIAGYVGLEYVGAKARHPLHDRLAVGTTALAVMTLATYGTKAIISEERPNGTRHNSFPSGHTALAFLGAELVRTEYGGAYGWTAYGIATATAVLRLANNKHWVNDVMAGAGIGILSAKVGCLLLPLERRLLGWDKRKNSSIALAPFYEPTTKGLGGALAIRL